MFFLSITLISGVHILIISVRELSTKIPYKIVHVVFILKTKEIINYDKCAFIILFLFSIFLLLWQTGRTFFTAFVKMLFSEVL